MSSGVNLVDVEQPFQIRHSETTQVPLAQSEHVDYLFHRLFALIQLLLSLFSTLYDNGGTTPFNCDEVLGCLKRGEPIGHPWDVTSKSRP